MFRYYWWSLNQYFKVIEMLPNVSQTNNFPSKYQKTHAKGLHVKADKISWDFWALVVSLIDRSSCWRVVLLSLLLVENLKNRITSAVFPLIHKIDFNLFNFKFLIDYWSNYGVDLASMKILYTEVSLSVGAIVHIHDYLPPWHLFSVPKGKQRVYPKEKREVLWQGSDVSPQNRTVT